MEQIIRPCSVSRYTPPKPQARSKIKTENQNIHGKNTIMKRNGNKNENRGVQRETFEAKIDVHFEKPFDNSLFYAQRQSLK